MKKFFTVFAFILSFYLDIYPIRETIIYDLKENKVPAILFNKKSYLNGIIPTCRSYLRVKEFREWFEKQYQTSIHLISEHEPDIYQYKKDGVLCTVKSSRFVKITYEKK